MKPVRWLREPLLHFLAIGALLFGVFHWRGGGGAQSNRMMLSWSLRGVL